MDFEKLLIDLNDIADRMEDRKTSIEECFKLFEYGLQLSEEATKFLNQYTKRLDVLKEKWEDIDAGLNNDD